jgi:two-component system, cell cycle response regulator
MSEEDRRYLAAAADRIVKLLAGQAAEPLRPGGLSPELEIFAENFVRLLEALEAMRRFAVAISNGDLNYAAPPRIHLLDPLKQLQSNLLHLTWQTKAIAAGDLDQHVDFLGEFSAAFNQMIQGLREKRATEEKVRYIGFHDVLTGLYNRTYFCEEMERLRSTRIYPVSFLIADIDGLKIANDTQGHQIGDLLIQRTSRVLAHSVRAEDVVARLGGDEFVVILQGADQAEADGLIARIRDAVDAHNGRNPSLFPISLSLGAGTAIDQGFLEEALRQADQAMYRDKMQRKAMARHKPSDL